MIDVINIKIGKVQFRKYIHILDDFLPNITGQCSDANTFEEYESFMLAEMRCSSNVECIGILDDKCDNAGSYRLCKRGFMYKYTTLSHGATCLFQKKAYTREFLYLYIQ